MLVEFCLAGLQLGRLCGQGRLHGLSGSHDRLCGGVAYGGVDEYAYSSYYNYCGCGKDKSCFGGGFHFFIAYCCCRLTRGVFFVFLLAKILNWLHKSEKVAVKSDFYT